MECPSLRRHQRGAEAAAGVPYASVEEPKKEPIGTGRAKTPQVSETRGTPMGQNVRKGRRSQVRWGS